MKNGIILEIAVPVRHEPSDRSEMVNQLLFGERYYVIEEQEKWVRIQSDHDSYEGWIDRKQHFEHQYETIEGKYCNAELKLLHKTRGELNVLPGSFICNNEILMDFEFNSANQVESIPMIREACMLYLNSPYLWGGRTPLGIDCSGFTQLALRTQGYSIPRDASQQVDLGEQILFVDESQEGDLAFFDNAEGKITHVGIILEEETEKKIIHASGRVRIDNIDHNGIFNIETQSYSHKLRTIKRINE
ncbi:MAG: NlpC/P60 family protein [Flavobacteriales bacterium]